MESKKHKHLTLDERRQIYFMLGKKMSAAAIARQLNRHHSTIYREIQRNSYWDEEDHSYNDYYPLCAQEFYRRRRQTLQLLRRNLELQGFIIEKLKSYWSPEQISGYLKHKGFKGFYACMETIYRFIYSDKGRELELYQYLYKARKNRRGLYRRKSRDSRIPDETGIAFRPEIVSTRETFGHWEGDLMIFSREHGKTNITSLIERKSRYTILAKNDNRRPDPVIKTIEKQLSKLPSEVTKTITFDRGFEFMSYPLLQQQLGMDSYFCDPQAPWQKGGVESNNKRIRRFLPSHTNLKDVSNADLYAISTIMNNTPRKCLGYKTPQEVLDEYLLEAA